MPAIRQPALPIQRPLVTVDIAIFTIHEDSLKVLLVRRSAAEPFANQWALPGGFVDIERDADLEACARRKLKEKTGVQRHPGSSRSAAGAGASAIRTAGRSRRSMPR